jgi:mycothiol system anti-sigma-R factor
MNPCHEYRADILLYLDNALTGRQLEDFRAHLSSCPDCKAQLEEELALSSLLRASRPLYPAPDGLRARVAAAAAGHDSARTPEPDLLHKARLRIFSQHVRHVAQRAFGWKTLTVTIFALVLCVLLAPAALRRARAMAYVKTAIATHRSYLNGELPLQIRSDSPKIVTSWFAGKTTFHFQLPISPPTLKGEPVYRLTGGRLVNYQGNSIALVTYETASEKISLLVASSTTAVAAGGEQVRSGGLTFHHHRDGSFNVISWTNRGLTYALVSSLSGSAQHSCLVCHQDIATQALPGRTTTGFVSSGSEKYGFVPPVFFIRTRNRCENHTCGVTLALYTCGRNSL